MLLAAREAEAGGAELVLDLFPEGGASQSLLDAVTHVAPGQAFVHAQAEGDVVEDRHRERGRLLEHHAHAGAQHRQVQLGLQDVVAVEQDLALGALARIEGVYPVDGAQQGGLAAAGGADQGGDVVGLDRQADRMERAGLAVEEVEVADMELDRAWRQVCGVGVEALAGDVVHERRGSRMRMRAMIWAARTAPVTRMAPTQARRRQSS